MAKKPQKPTAAKLSEHAAVDAMHSALMGLQSIDTETLLAKAGVSRSSLVLLMDDDEIYQCVEKRQEALISEELRFDLDLPETPILKDLLDEWWPEIAVGAQKAKWYGYNVLEAVWDDKAYHAATGKDYIGFKWIGEKPFYWFRPTYMGELVLKSTYSNSRVDTVVDQKYKFFMTQCKPTFTQPYGEALFSRLYWIKFFRTNGFKFWAKFVERFANPLLVGKAIRPDDMLKVLLAAHTAGVVSVNTNEEVSVVGANSNSGGDAAFNNFDKRLERSIQKLILGQTLTSGTDGSGSRALGDVHLEVQRDKLRSDKRMILPTVQAIVNAICDLNGWQRHRVIIGEEKNLQKDKAERDKVLKDAGAQFTPQYFAREYGLQQGDVLDVTPTTFSAVKPQAFSFAAATNKLSPDQLEVEEITDSQGAFKVLDADELKQLVLESQNQADMVQKLTELMAGASAEQFTAALQQALYTADVFGYVVASEGR